MGINIRDYNIKYGEYTDGPNIDIIYESHQNVNGLTKIEFDTYWNKVYFDSISGVNYTGTIRDHIANDYRIRLMAKESALTRITIIDERIFDNIKQWVNINTFFDNSVRKPFIGTQIEQSFRNIRILNYFENNLKNTNISTVHGFEILKGNEFRPVGPLSNFENATHFLTIHVGIIEKMLKNSAFLENESYCGEKRGNPLSPERVTRLMDIIKDVFFADNTVPFICIHSGRGGLSNELRQTELIDYPFIPYITLEHLFSDSKFLFSSMFYSRVYQNTK